MLGLDAGRTENSSHLLTGVAARPDHVDLPGTGPRRGHDRVGQPLPGLGHPVARLGDSLLRFEDGVLCLGVGTRCRFKVPEHAASQSPGGVRPPKNGLMRPQTG